MNRTIIPLAALVVLLACVVVFAPVLADEPATPKDYATLQGGKWQTRGFVGSGRGAIAKAVLDLTLQIEALEGGKVAGTYTMTGGASGVTPFSAKTSTTPDGNLRFGFKNSMGTYTECELQNDGSFKLSNGAVLKRIGSAP
jgi:hypothetical protein